MSTSHQQSSVEGRRRCKVLSEFWATSTETQKKDGKWNGVMFPQEHMHHRLVWGHHRLLAGHSDSKIFMPMKRENLRPRCGQFCFILGGHVVCPLTSGVVATCSYIIILGIWTSGTSRHKNESHVCVTVHIYIYIMTTEYGNIVILLYIYKIDDNIVRCIYIFI